MNRLQEFREGKRWTQTQLAFHAGVSIRTISNLESGKRPRVTYPIRKALADALGIPIDTVFPEPEFEESSA